MLSNAYKSFCNANEFVDYFILIQNLTSRCHQLQKNNEDDKSGVKVEINLSIYEAIFVENFELIDIYGVIIVEDFLVIDLTIHGFN